MTPEAMRYLDKAHKCLMNARISLSVNLTGDAGRSSYLAAFHAAQAFIFERPGKIAKSHKGVHTEFARLVRDRSELDRSLAASLQRAYNLKVVADYETGPDSDIAPERAVGAIEDAGKFVSTVQNALTLQ